ncbi:hypothetical protein ABPG74_016880 [Tetrahymena malaccensis]
MGSCSSRSDKDEVKDVIKIQKGHNNEIEQQADKRQKGALNKRLSINYNKIPNKIHKQDTRFQQGIIEVDEISGLVGLSNLGNTCFMNSALQCLSNVPPLCDYFLSKLHEKEINYDSFLGSQGKITQQFAELMIDMWNTSDSYIIPQKFLRTIGNYGPQFADGSQQDSHEFLAFLMDILHEDLNRVKQKPYIEGKDYNGNEYEKYAKESWKEYLMRNRSIIVDLFQGQTKSTLRCLKCNTVSHKFETFMYLSVPIPDSQKSKKYSSKRSIEEESESFSLQRCIQEFTKEEKLERGELWFCPKCKKHQESTKKIDLWKMPNILIIHLKRFEFNKDRRCKLSNKIDFPIKNFDISSLTAGKQRDVPTYDLFAVSNHGGTLSSGHYTSYAKNRIDQNWYFFNDTQVQYVEDPEDKLSSSQSYVLFYSKTSVEEFFRQTLSDPESWPHFYIEEQKDDKQKEDSKENGTDELNGNRRKRSTKLHTYKFTNEIQKRDSKLYSNILPQNSNIQNIEEINNNHNTSQNRNGSQTKLNNGKSQTNIKSQTQFEMMNSIINEEEFQGNLDNSFNISKEIKQLDKMNQRSSKNSKIQVSNSQVKQRNIQYFGNDQKTASINVIISPRDENKIQNQNSKYYIENSYGKNTQSTQNNQQAFNFQYQ